MRAALIAKPPAGRSSKTKDLALVFDQLAERHIHCEVFETQYHAHALEIVRGLELNRFDALIAMGGDGTNFHVLNGVLKFHGDEPLPPLGIIPAGRGNSFARDLNIHSTADGIAAISRQRTLAVDVCRFTQDRESYYFVNLMGFGFVTDAAQTAARFGGTGHVFFKSSIW